MSKLIALSLAEIKPVYYPGEELVSLDVLKLYRGEDVVQQNPKDIHPDRRADEGELTELQKISLGELERVYLETGQGPMSLEIPTEPEPEPDIHVTQEDMAEREGIHERIGVEIQNENKETRA